MEIKGNIKYTLLTVTLFVVHITVHSQEVENKYQTRTSAELSFKPLKKLKLSFIPEFRFDEEFSLDKYVIEGELKYNPVDFFSLTGGYGLMASIRKTKETEYFNRYFFSGTFKKTYNRFEPSFRLMYSNYADDEIYDKKYLRYKASLKYDIENCKITPFVAAQAFQQLNDGSLYKMRYALGADYKLLKNNYLGASYKLDYYMKKIKNRHIFGITYKLKF